MTCGGLSRGPADGQPEGERKRGVPMECHVCESAQAACEAAGLLMAAQITRVTTDIIHLHSPYAWDLPRDKYLLMQCKISEFFLKVNDCTLVNGVGDVWIVYIKRAGRRKIP